MGNWLEQIVNAGKAYLDYDVAKTQASQSSNKSQTNAGANTSVSILNDPTFKAVAVIGGIGILIIGGALAIKRLFS